jgi:hypothetical protein
LFLQKNQKLCPDPNVSFDTAIIFPIFKSFHKSTYMLTSNRYLRHNRQQDRAVSDGTSPQVVSADSVCSVTRPEIPGTHQEMETMKLKTGNTMDRVMNDRWAEMYCLQGIRTHGKPECWRKDSGGNPQQSQAQQYVQTAMTGYFRSWIPPYDPAAKGASG